MKSISGERNIFMLELYLQHNLLSRDYVIARYVDMHREYFLFLLRSITRAIGLIKMVTSVVIFVHLLLLSCIVKYLLENLVGGHSCYCRKTGKRYMKQYRDKFVQYFPTLIAEITRLDGCRDTDHLKEVCIRNS